MSKLTRTLIPPSQRYSIDGLLDLLDLSHGDALSKRTGFLIMLVLSGVIAVAGVLADSTATVIGAMIIAPLGTPILGIAAGIVTGHPGLVARSVMWVLSGLGIVVVIGVLLSVFIADPDVLTTNGQITGRTSPRMVDLAAALATGTAGAFAMSRKDLSAVLPGVAIAISLVPPLGVVGVCAGQGAWNEALGALILFLCNVFALVIAGSIVFTMAGYARNPHASPTTNRKRAYSIVGVLAILIAVPLAVNSVITIYYARMTYAIHEATGAWLDDADIDYDIGSITWTNRNANVEVSTEDGSLGDQSKLESSLTELPDWVTVTIHVTPATSHVVYGGS
ncbi:TIGR00341 family protein [Microbacterium thalassium]|uniref:Putative hydrophobic protein (TIGR00271 family) n=1 Tax=Microbacterium thalassium TaxID=362649 RepID=A0A7X0KVQ8_9MICO|nr:TIGR00341 family protein [Microbacterium thalassium]MBB6392492.1 putative hydrophobic protein (TIGR00271 family) [Microbacterium thalassium]GLK23276.1 membrane protein [Microbacterium thalassium]